MCFHRRGPPDRTADPHNSVQNERLGISPGALQDIRAGAFRYAFWLLGLLLRQSTRLIDRFVRQSDGLTDAERGSGYIIRG
jgi:hypothetical protein